MLNSNLSFPDVVNFFIKESRQPSAKMSLPPEKVSELKQLINNHICKVSENSTLSSLNSIVVYSMTLKFVFVWYNGLLPLNN